MCVYKRKLIIGYSCDNKRVYYIGIIVRNGDLNAASASNVFKRPICHAHYCNFSLSLSLFDIVSGFNEGIFSKPYNVGRT